MNRFFYAITAALLLPALAGAQKPAAPHPDLSGLWLFSIDLPPTALKKEAGGKVEIKRIDASGRRPAKSDVPGALAGRHAGGRIHEFRRANVVWRRGVFTFRCYARCRALLARGREPGVPGNSGGSKGSDCVVDNAGPRGEAIDGGIRGIAAMRR